MSDIDTGLNVWQMQSNHNRMIEIQNERVAGRDGPVEIAFYGSSAFKITSPRGVSVMIDPWRNHPSRRWDWYFYDFPVTAVDIGTSTHAHFDHDALHRLSMVSPINTRRTRVARCMTSRRFINDFMARR